MQKKHMTQSLVLLLFAICT